MTDQEKREMVENEERGREEVKQKRGVWSAVMETYNNFSTKDAMTQAAALAFYSGLSLAPLLTIMTWIIRTFFGTDAKEKIASAFEQVIGQRAAAPIREILDPASTQAASGINIAGLISLGILAFTASAVFGQLQTALNHMWEVQAAPSAGWGVYIRKRLFSFGMLLSIMFLLLISLVLSTVIQGVINATGIDQGWLITIINNLISLAIFTALFTLMFRYVPDAKLAWRDVWFGAVLSAVMFVIGKYLLGLYLGRGSYESSYGAAVGSFVALLVWVYYSSIIVFIGAEAAQVHTRRRGHRVQPEDYAVKVEQKVRPVPSP